MKKVLVTGANGYIGKYVVNELLDRGFMVYACDVKIDNEDERISKKCVSIFTGDKGIYKRLGSLDICIHLAWRNGLVHNSETHIGDINKHFIFLKNMIMGGLKHVSIVGTMHEVGFYNGIIDENTPTNPCTLFGVAKNSLRQLVEILAKENDVTYQWLRAFYITGDDLKSNLIFSKILKMKMEGEDTIPLAIGKNKYDFISVEELAKQIVAASTQEEITGIINCCSGTPVSLSKKVEEFIKKNNLKMDIKAVPEDEDAPAIWGDNTKIKEILLKQKR